MNSLSWFLYGIDVIANLRTLACVVLAGTSVCWILLNVSVAITEGDTLKWPDFKKWWTRGVVAMVVCGIAVSALPSSNTMYAIAASQVGEKIAQSETVQGIASDATKALQQWIKRQIEPEKKS